MNGENARRKLAEDPRWLARTFARLHADVADFLAAHALRELGRL